MSPLPGRAGPVADVREIRRTHCAGARAGAGCRRGVLGAAVEGHVPLRHDPAAYGLTLDPEGWTPVAALVEGLRVAGLPASVEAVREVVTSGSKQRHELRGEWIRARYGHSVEGAVELPVADPPDVLFHGTTSDAAEVIAVQGLRPMGRQYVHLSPARSTAEVGGRRVAAPVVFTVDAAGAARAGVVFRRGNEDTWLAPSVPPEFLSR